MRFNRKLFKEAFKKGYKAAKRLNEAKFVKIDGFPEWAINYAMYPTEYESQEHLEDDEKEFVDEFLAEHGSLINVDFESEEFCDEPLYGLPCTCYTVTVAR